MSKERFKFFFCSQTYIYIWTPWLITLVFTDFIRFAQQLGQGTAQPRTDYFGELRDALVKNRCVLLDVVLGVLSYPEDTNTQIWCTDCGHLLPNRVA